jgi:hypothetical protein
LARDAKVMTIIKIPYDFISQRVKMGWNEIKFGLDHQIVGPEAAIKKATECLRDKITNSKEEIDLVICPIKDFTKQ